MKAPMETFQMRRRLALTAAVGAALTGLLGYCALLGEPSPTTNSPSGGVTNSVRGDGVNGSTNALNKATTNQPAAVVDDLSYEAFKLINDRNIFSSTRTRSSAREENRNQPKKVRVDKFALVGTMSYFKGSFAFFDGSESGYRKSVKVGDKVAGFEVQGISQDSAKLVSGTNTVVLKVGTGMQREEEGDWQPSSTSGGFETASAKSEKTEKSEGGSSEASGGGESEILKRLLEKREKELKNEK
jgi:hypothetical protein